MRYHHKKVTYISLESQEDREKGIEYLFKEIIAKNFPNMKKDLDIQHYAANKWPQIFNKKHTSALTSLAQLIECWSAD